MPDTDNKALIGELGLDISDVVDAQSTLKTTFSKDFQYINVETVRFVAEIQKKFGKLDETTLKHAQALLESAKLAKAQQSQYEALGKAIGSLVVGMDSVKKKQETIDQLFRMFIPYNEELAKLFKKTAEEAAASASVIEGSAKAQRKLASDTETTNQKLKEQNKLLSGTDTPQPKTTTKTETKKGKSKKTRQAASSATHVEDAARSAEHLSESAHDATQSVQTLTNTLSQPTSSPTPMSAPVEEVKEKAQEAKQEVISLGDAIKSIGRKTYKDKELAQLDKSLEQSYAGIYGTKGIEKVNKLNYEEVGQSLDEVKKRYESFFTDIFQMFRNKNLGELGTSISKLMGYTNFENDRYGNAKDWRRELFDGVDQKSFNDYLSKILDGTTSKEAEQAFRSRIKRIIENANQMRAQLEANFSEAYAAVSKYESKAKVTTQETPAQTQSETKRQNIAVQHLETILKLRQEIAAAGNASKAPEEKELQLYEYLANSLVIAKREGNTSFIDEAKEKYKSLFAEFEKAKGIPSLLKLIMEGADGAESYLTGRTVSGSTGKKTGKNKKTKETHAQTPEAASTENAQALIQKMERLRDLLKEMENLDVGSTEFLRAEREASQQNAEIKGFYSTIQNQIPECEARTQALARVEFSRRDVLKDISEQQKTYAQSLLDIQNQGADNALVQEYEATQKSLVDENRKLIDITFKLRQERKTLHSAEQTQNTELISKTKESIANLEKEKQVIEEQQQAYKSKLNLIRYGAVETKKAEEASAPKKESKKKESSVEVLETDFEKYGISSKSKRLVEVYKTEEQALARVVSLLKERKKYGEGTDRYNDLTKQIEDASKELEKAHWSLLNTRKAGTAAERSTLKNAIAQQAMQAVEELNSAGIKIEAIITRITQTTKAGFRNAVNGAVGSTKRDQAAMQDALFDGGANRRGSKSSEGTATKKDKKDLSEVDQILKNINKSMDDYVRRSGDQAKYHTGSKKYVKAEEDRAAALKTISELYQKLLKDIPDSEAKTKALAAIEERRAKIAEEIEKNSNPETHKDKKSEDADKAVKAAKKQKEALSELTSAFEGKTAAEKKSEESGKSGEAASERRSRSKKKEAAETEQTTQASRKSAEAKREEATAQEKLNDAVEKGTKGQAKGSSGKTSGKRTSSGRKGSGSSSSLSSSSRSGVDQEQRQAQKKAEAAKKAADDEAAAYEKAEARKAAALEKARKAQQEYNVAELNKRNKERAEYADWWEQELLKQDSEMFDAPEAAVNRIVKAYEELFKIQKRLEASKGGTAEYSSLVAEEQKAREAVSSALDSVDALNATEEAKKALVEEAIEAARTTKAYQDLHAARTKREDADAKKQTTPEEQVLDEIKQEIALVNQLNSLKKQQAAETSFSARSQYDEDIRSIEDMIAAHRRTRTEIMQNNAELQDNENILRQLILLEDRIRKGEKDVNKERQKGNALLGALAKVKEGFLLSVGNAAYRMVENFVEDKIREFWTNGWEYAQSYYDQLNEIRIVTGQTAEEAEAMGKVYRNMAKEMSVSSTDIASAAVEFWRQGLNENEVNSRLKNTTQYAKISGLAFQDAAELVTAATNSMDLDAQRVVDVFAYLGDASASGNPLISHLAQQCA